MTEATSNKQSGHTRARRFCAAGLVWLCGLALVGAATANTPSATAPHPVRTDSINKPAAAKPIKPLDINSATPSELKTLPGIGDAEARRIIATRPHLSKADIVANAGIPTGVYLSIRRQIIAIQKSPPKPKG